MVLQFFRKSEFKNTVYFEQAHSTVQLILIGIKLIIKNTTFLLLFIFSPNEPKEFIA
jgi:hypothetical protein